ncbi:uncharacterized protein B0T23DRAFT_311171 [Neurospora hispaniola]|uniref:Uncharacterized protein n=1 Tax=Neurospora hispaniola TaxID=588809 RepID=A0AAJ0IDR2_9PEZI|nr:hypothetical protein B0T23DRAFT_311171 [Neurospora hispaniola]
MAYHQTESKSWKGATRSAPNYTRVDYGRFPESLPPLIPIGQTSKIGKIEVDCRFLCSRSRWGKMSNGGPGPRLSDTYPAGILYLDLAFRQPADCRLQSAKIAVTLGRDDYMLQKSEPAVFMTGHYGPRQLSGPRQSIQTRQLDEFRPQVGVGGYVEVGGVGRQKEKLQTIADSWRFSGYLRSVDGCPNYNRLEWVLDESFLEERPTHGPIFHTAFAIGHNARAFYLTVEVTGTLARKRDKFKNWSREKFKFGGSKDTPQNQATIKFQWRNGYSSAKLPLDVEAQYLSQAMDLENMHSIPIVIPEPQPAAFYSPAMHSEAATDTRRTSVRPDNVMLPTAGNNTAEARIPRLQTDVPPRPLWLTDALPNLKPSTDENIAWAAGLDSVGRSGSIDLDSLDLTTTPKTVSGGTTLVDDDQDSESPWESNSTARRTVERQAKTSDESSAEKTMKGENHPFNEPPMEVGLMLKLLHWLQCVTIWELISAMLGVAALTGESRADKGDWGRQGK